MPESVSGGSGGRTPKNDDEPVEVLPETTITQEQERV